MLRTNLSTRRSTTCARCSAALGRGSRRRARLHAVQRRRRSCGSDSASRRWARSAAEAEQEAARLRGDAAQIRAQINPQELEVVANAAREANSIIDQRAFSWTELFAQFEATLPPDVRITAVQPRLDDNGMFIVAIGVEARRAEDLDAFIEALENGGAFRDVLAVREQTSEEG